MPLTLDQWHQRFKQQAQWTSSLRNYLYNKIDIYHAERILDVGCGTGILLEELNQLSPGLAYGVDINYFSLEFIHKALPMSLLIQGNALCLPYRSRVFDVALCHFLLLWVKDPLQVIKEMTRAVHPGGYVMALAEPDYGGRIDFPVELAQLGKWHSEALREQGANPLIGRELQSLFALAGLSNIETGVLGGRWVAQQTEQEIELEWFVLQTDLSQKEEFIRSAAEFKALDRISRSKQQRILYVPTFYAFGRVES
jgi:ubiquinone/menaquinone biosynthesis C-methylase UbiE